jgi:hypothetical protein
MLSNKCWRLQRLKDRDKGIEPGQPVQEDEIGF